MSATKTERGWSESDQKQGEGGKEGGAGEGLDAQDQERQRQPVLSSDYGACSLSGSLHER